MSCLIFFVLFTPTTGFTSQLGELSVMGSYSKTSYGGTTYSATRRYRISAAYNILPLTEIEIAFSYSDTFVNFDPVQTTSINEQALSLSGVQSLTPVDWITQLYLKAGAAQYNRKENGTIYGIPRKENYTKSPSAVLGAGVRMLLLRSFSLKIEGVTYLPELKFSQLSDNFSVQGGVGWHF